MTLSSPYDLLRMELYGKLAAKHVRRLRQEMAAHGCPFMDDYIKEMCLCADCSDKDQKARLLEHAYGETNSYKAIDQSVVVVKSAKSVPHASVSPLKQTTDPQDL